MVAIVSKHSTGWLLTAAVLGSVLPVAPSPAREMSAAESRLHDDVAYLADDAREGRGPGTDGIEAAAEYIAGVFKEAGLKPASGSGGYFQPFTISGDAKLVGSQSLGLKGPEDKALSADPKVDFNPLAIGEGGTLDGVPVAFGGYGITAEDESEKLHYDDYADLDAKGKAVLVIRREPQQDDDESPFSGKRTSRFATFNHKVTNAFQHGAAALLIVNDLSAVEGDKKDELIGFNTAGTSRVSNLPVLMVTREFADKLLADAGQPTLKELEAQIDEDLKPRSKVLDGWKLDATIGIERKPIETRNVIGVLEGTGPLADETIVVGAHYDHLGRGGSGSLASSSKEIHNGADDNASGTAMILEMARRLAARRDPLPRRVVFVAFSGEERGLLGSAHYVKEPAYPLAKTVMMVNFDMVGRLNDKSELTVYGTGTSKGIEGLVDALGSVRGFAIKKIADGYGPSDHASFYTKDIPVLFVFTGTHRDYHRPSDDVETINFPGMARVADFSEILLLDIAARPERPGFIKVARSGRGGGSDPGRVSVSVYLGTIPSYDDDQKGVKLTGVREKSPAEAGGLKADDVIIGLGGKPIQTINDFMELMARYKVGDTVPIVVNRAGQETTLSVTFGTRPQE